MYKYQDRVWIKRGNYKGQFGVIVDYYAYGTPILENIVYVLEIDVVGGRPCERKVVIECDEYELEKI